MANFAKYTDHEAIEILGHTMRIHHVWSNIDIDPDRTHLNYSLTPDKGKAYYQKVKDEVYIYGRRNTITMCSCLVTCPKEITDIEEQKRFFQASYDFLSEKFGGPNGKYVLRADIHYDEGIRKNVQGNDYIIGMPHLHFCWMPAVKINHEELHKPNPKTGKPKRYPREMDRYDYKVTAKEVINRIMLKKFHPEFQTYLIKHGIKGNVHSGITKELGGNRTVKELKLESAREYIKELERQITIERENVMSLQKTLSETTYTMQHMQDRIRELTKNLDNANKKIKKMDHEVHHEKRSGWSIKKPNYERSHEWEF